MADRLQFKEKLAGVLALAEDQNGKITVDEVEKYFEEDGLSQEQMNLVCDYLLSMKMAVIGYKQAGGTVKDAENEEQQPLSPEEQKYVEEYLRSLGDMKTPMILNISGNLINCVLNFLFIYDTRTLSLFGHEFTMWGAGWGVSGAAFGTAVSNTFVGLFMFSAVMIRENPLKVPLHTCLHPQKNIILRMIVIA